MITEAHNYTLINTWIYGMGDECNTGMEGQYTLATHTQACTLTDMHTLARPHMLARIVERSMYSIWMQSQCEMHGG